MMWIWACVCPIFSLEMLQAGPVKGLTITFMHSSLHWQEKYKHTYREQYNIIWGSIASIKMSQADAEKNPYTNWVWKYINRSSLTVIHVFMVNDHFKQTLGLFVLQLVVWATDTKDTTKISARTLIVELIDIDDNLPSFRKSIYASCPVDVSLLVFDLCGELPWQTTCLWLWPYFGWKLCFYRNWM